MEHAKQLFLVSMVSQIKETNLCVCAKSFWQSSKEPAYQRGRLWRCRFDPWVGKIPWRRARQPTLENPMDRGAWRATAHGVAKSWTRLKRLSRHAQSAHFPCAYTPKRSTFLAEADGGLTRSFKWPASRCRQVCACPGATGAVCLV